MKNILKKKKGFTLIELIIVIAIIAILALIAVPKFGSVQKDAKIKADVASAKQIANVTSMLLTQGVLDTPTKSANSKMVKVAFYDANKEDNIKNNLQTVPVPELKTNQHFYVGVDQNGGVIVFVGADNATVPSEGDYSATGFTVNGFTQVYPKAEGEYAK